MVFCGYLKLQSQLGVFTFFLGELYLESLNKLFIVAKGLYSAFKHGL